MRSAAVLLGLLLAVCAPVLAQPEPEAATGFLQRPVARAPTAMVVSADSRASAVAIEVLRRGGSALDAAIAALMVLNLVEPQSSGIGGGGFLVYYDASRRRVRTYDGRESAPAVADDEWFLQADGTPLPFREAVADGRAIGVPGLLRMLELAHRQHGRLPWASLFEPAIRLAQQGFEVSPRLNALLAIEARAGRFVHRAAREYFLQPDGMAWPVGHRLRNPELAATLTEIAAGGADAFYRGPLAQRIVAMVAAHPLRAGGLSTEDLATYRALEREPLCAPYRRHRVCGMGPPSSGASTVLAILGQLERFELSQLDPDAAIITHLFSEAGRRAFADRDHYLADPDFTAVPLRELLDPAYLARRADEIRFDVGGAEARPGLEDSAAGGVSPERAATTHLSIVDGEGNALALTASIEDAFGNRSLVGGFALNNQLTDFSFRPQQDGRPLANRVAGGKRPRSAMAPTLVFAPDGRLFAVLGSPGGSQIINYVAQALLGLLDWRLDPRIVVARARVGSRNGPTEVEAGSTAETQRGVLEAFGHRVQTMPMTSGLNLIVREGDAWVGAADPRREGVAAGF